MQPPLGGRWFLYHDFYSNPWIFAVTQRFIGIATLLSGNCGISNPILSCALESPESLETTGIAGRRDPEVGSIATRPTFSRLFFDRFSGAIFDWIIFHFNAYLCNKFAPLFAESLCGCWRRGRCPSQIASRRVYRCLPCSNSTTGLN